MVVDLYAGKDLPLSGIGTYRGVHHCALDMGGAPFSAPELKRLNGSQYYAESPVLNLGFVGFRVLMVGCFWTDLPVHWLPALSDEAVKLDDGVNLSRGGARPKWGRLWGRTSGMKI